MIPQYKTKLPNKIKPQTDRNRFCYSGRIVLLCKNAFRNYQKLPPALVSSPNTPEDTVEQIFIAIGRAITHSYDVDETCPETVATLAQRILRAYKIQIGPEDVKNAIWYGIDKGSLVRRELSEALYSLVGDATLEYADKLISSSASSASSSPLSSPSPSALPSTSTSPSSSPASTPRGLFLDTLTPEGATTNTPSASNSELPSSSSSTPRTSFLDTSIEGPTTNTPVAEPTVPSSSTSPLPSSNPSESTSSINEEHSFLSSVGTYISEHKLLIIGSVAAVVVVGTIIYILWKRRGPTPPTGNESMPSHESAKNNTQVTSEVVSKFVHALICLSFLSIFLNFTYIITTI